MSGPIIAVENLSKSYLVGHQGPQDQYQSFRESIVRHGRNFGRKAVDMARGKQIIQGDSVEEFWALKNVTFSVNQGEVLGIIGRNGAGKSTLLKVLSQITEPTKGRITLNGRIASLLEVGTGFHPELTGRENIFLNGAILGMSRSEIKAKFDEIIDFAGVENFLDTPVKRFSSGMYVRLAFSVAAHLEPEILVVDEVLAVGDSEFQNKCLGKMQTVAQNGRTVLFVSHNLPVVKQLCQSGIVLSRGEVIYEGLIEDALAEYKKRGNSGERELLGPLDGPRMTAVSLCEETLKNEALKISISYESPYEIKVPLVGIVITDDVGTPLGGHNTWMDPDYVPTVGRSGMIEFKTDRIPLCPGNYFLSFFFGNENQNTHIERNYLEFTLYGQPLPGGLSSSDIGATQINGSWRIN